MQNDYSKGWRTIFTLLAVFVIAICLPQLKASLPPDQYSKVFWLIVIPIAAVSAAVFISGTVQGIKEEEAKAAQKLEEKLWGDEQRQATRQLFSRFSRPLSEIYGALTHYPPDLLPDSAKAEAKRSLLPFVEFICAVRGQPAREALRHYSENHPDVWPDEFFKKFPFTAITQTDIDAVGYDAVHRFLLDTLTDPLKIYPNDFALPEETIRERIRADRTQQEETNRERALKGLPVLPVHERPAHHIHRQQFAAVLENKSSLYYSDMNRLADGWRARLDRECVRPLAATGQALVFGEPPAPDDRRSRLYPIESAYECAVPYGEPLFRHTYIIGKTGSGKTTLLKNLIAQHIQNGQGLIILSPENKLFDEILDYVPPERAQDLIYFDPVATTPPFVSFNPFTLEEGELLFERAGQVYAVLESALGDLGDSMKTLLNKSVYTLLQRPGSTLKDLERLLKPNGDFRRAIIQDRRIDEDTREWWRDTYEAKGSLLPKSAEAILRRLDAFFMPPLSSTISGASFGLSEALNAQKSIFLFNLSRLKGLQAEVMGQILVSLVLQTLLTRDQQPDTSFLPYHLIIDEFQTYAGTSEKTFIEMFNRARKYRMSVTLAHQVTANIPPALISTIIGNAGTKVVMERPSEDAGFFAKELQLKTPDKETFNAPVLQNLNPHEFFLVTPANKKGVILKTPFDLCPKTAMPCTIQHMTAGSLDEWRTVLKTVSRTTYGYTPANPDDSPTPGTNNAEASSPSSDDDPESSFAVT
jgi:energy-coupling factor transporter ATP-binding protein EcfA2